MNAISAASADKRDLIVQTADEVIEGKLDDHFPCAFGRPAQAPRLHEPTSHLQPAIEIAGGERGSKNPVTRTTM